MVDRHLGLVASRRHQSLLSRDIVETTSVPFSVLALPLLWTSKHNFDAENFDVFLATHCHESRILNLSDATGADCAALQRGACIVDDAFRRDSAKRQCRTGVFPLRV